MPELLESLDEKGRPTGQRKSWLNLINDGDWRNVVHVWIVDSKKLLLIQQRAAKGAWDGCWDVSLGGSVSAGEKPAQAAIRELKEELGLDINEGELKKLGIWNVRKRLPEHDKDSREFSHNYLLNKDLQLDDLTLQKSEVVRVGWKSLIDVRRQIEDDKLYEKWVPHPKEYYFGVIAAIDEMGNK
jgi:isopentenyl-diphosphate Delta-isomerase